MYSPTLRLLTALELLQSRESISGTELALCLEVDDRSVRRYMTMLQNLGIPIEATRGRHGTYRLRPGFKLPPLMFNDDEALSVILGLLLIQTKGLAFATPSVEGAIAKIGRVLPPRLRERVQVLQQVIELVPHLNYDAIMTSGELILQLSEAIYRHQRVWLVYRSEKGEQTERFLDPYGLAHWAGRWYTVGYCHLRQTLRAFRLDRIERVVMQPDQFEGVANFDCTNYLLHSFGSALPRWEIEVVFEANRLSQGQKKILEAYGELKTGPDNTQIYQSLTDDLLETARFLVDFRCKFKVTKPAQLKTALRQLAGEINLLAD